MVSFLYSKTVLSNFSLMYKSLHGFCNACKSIFSLRQPCKWYKLLCLENQVDVLLQNGLWQISDFWRFCNRLCKKRFRRFEQLDLRQYLQQKWNWTKKSWNYSRVFPHTHSESLSEISNFSVKSYCSILFYFKNWSGLMIFFKAFALIPWICLAWR